MLQQLVIHNFALIEALDLELGPGLNIVSGETGAGKSIMIGALQLLLGQRAEKSVIRSGAAGCDVSAVLALGARPVLLATVDGLLDAAGAPRCEDGQLVLRRQVTAAGSRHYVNSCPVTLQVLRDLGELLVDVHGPYDHQSLLRPVLQRAALDAYGDLEDGVAAVATAWAALLAARAELDAFRAETPSPELADVLRHQLKEIEDAKLEVGEDDDLTRRHAVAANASEILDLLYSCRRRLDGDDGATGLLAQTLRDLHQLERLDESTGRRFAEPVELLTSQLQDIVIELGDCAHDVDIDPAALQQMEDRLALLRRLKRKYGGDVEAVLAFAESARERLARLDDREAAETRLRAAVAAAEVAARDAARLLSQDRRHAAAKLAPAVARQLHDLGFPEADFGISVNEAPLGASGIDAVEFQFCPNPGEGSQPLRHIASSGEISRVMLALKTVLAHADQVPILVFDEVDANIGGVVATQVGAQLRQLGRDHQVICITHLPQVAAGADSHFQVTKSTRGKRTVAAVTPLAAADRVDEIARMLGGADSSKVVREHAAELIARARTA